MPPGRLRPLPGPHGRRRCHGGTGAPALSPQELFEGHTRLLARFSLECKLAAESLEPTGERQLVGLQHHAPHRLGATRLEHTGPCDNREPVVAERDLDPADALLLREPAECATLDDDPSR